VAGVGAYGDVADETWMLESVVVESPLEFGVAFMVEEDWDAVATVDFEPPPSKPPLPLPLPDPTPPSVPVTTTGNRGSTTDAGVILIARLASCVWLFVVASGGGELCDCDCD